MGGIIQKWMFETVYEELQNTEWTCVAVMSTATPRTPVPHIHRNVSAFPEQGSGRNTGFP